MSSSEFIRFTHRRFSLKLIKTYLIIFIFIFWFGAQLFPFFGAHLCRFLVLISHITDLVLICPFFWCSKHPSSRSDCSSKDLLSCGIIDILWVLFGIIMLAITNSRSINRNHQTASNDITFIIGTTNQANRKEK